MPVTTCGAAFIRILLGGSVYRASSRLFRHGPQFDLANQNFGAFRLNLDLADRARTFRPVVHDNAVENACQRIAVGDDLLPVPLSDGFFDVLWAPIPEQVLPGRIPAEP